MKADQPEVFFHAGLPKTASTFLQKAVFPYLNGIEFAPKKQYKKHEQVVANSQSAKILFSFELDRNLESDLKRFVKAHPHARIILVFRRHDRWIASKYRYYIRKNGHLDWQGFFDLEKDGGIWKQSELIYMDKIRLVQAMFPMPPLVLFQDDLKKQPYKLLDALAKYMDVSYQKERISLKVVKKNYADPQLKVMRSYNRLFPVKPDWKPQTFMAKLSYKCREAIVHSLANLSRLIPARFLLSETLVPQMDLDQIRKRYESDWQECQDFAQKHSP